MAAVTDPGLQLDLPDLKDSLWRNPVENPGNGVDDDGNGFIDDVHGYDFAGRNGRDGRDNDQWIECAGAVPGRHASTQLMNSCFVW